MMRPDTDQISVTHTVDSQNFLQKKKYSIDGVGVVTEKAYVHEQFNLREYKTSLRDTVCVQMEDERMLDMVNVCASLQGGIRVDASGRGFNKTLGTKKFHAVYVPEPKYAVAFDKNALTYQLGIQRDYYLHLIEACGVIQEIEHRKIANSEFCFSGDFKVSASMCNTFQQALHHPYENSLSALWMESKVMELIALQFHFRNEQCGNIEGVLKKDRDVLYSVKEYIDLNISESFSLQGLSRHFGLNEFKLKSGFKAIFSSTVFDYIYEVRMQEALILLQEHHLSVSEVSRRVGYKKSNHFATAFKRRFSISPSQLK